MPPIELFFLPGSAMDPSYLNVRDQSHLAFAKTFTETLWQTYAPYSDPHFRSDARNHFLQRFWEMYITCALLERGIKIERVGHEGPEYYIVVENKRVWIEAIAPEAGIGDNKVPDIKLGEAYPVPTENILMRFTNALVEKNRKYKVAVSKGIIAPDEPIILAINSRAIPHAPFGAELPYYVKALLPIGNLQISINTRTLESSEPSYQYRNLVLKANGSPVATTSFLNPAFSHFTAVIHSGVDCANRPSLLGADFSVLHNPTSSFQLPAQLFSWCQQFKFENSALYETSPEQPQIVFI